MNIRRISAFLLFAAFTFPAFADPLEACKEHVKYGAPSTKPALLCRLGYLLAHDAQHKVPNWVAYHVTRERIQMGNVPRSDDFRPDPDLDPGSRSELKDHKGSGFDRGHTRLNKFNDKEQGRLINWGYALADAAMRKYVLVQDPGPRHWPLPNFAPG